MISRETVKLIGLLLASELDRFAWMKKIRPATHSSKRPSKVNKDLQVRHQQSNDTPKAI